MQSSSFCEYLYLQFICTVPSITEKLSVWTNGDGAAMQYCAYNQCFCPSPAPLETNQLFLTGNNLGFVGFFPAASQLECTSAASLLVRSCMNFLANK